MSLPIRFLENDSYVKKIGGKIKKLKKRDPLTNSTIDPTEIPKIEILLRRGYSPSAIRKKIVRGSDTNLDHIIRISEDIGIFWDRSSAYSGNKNPNYDNPTNYKHKTNYSEQQIDNIFSFKKEKHWNWDGGRSAYPDEFNNLIKFFIQVMDNFTCNNCEKNQSEIGYCQVHHIDCDKSNTNVDNLCLMCKKCHMGSAHKTLEKKKDIIYKKVLDKRIKKWPEIVQRLKEILGREKLQTICQIYSTDHLCEFPILDRLLEELIHTENKV